MLLIILVFLFFNFVDAQEIFVADTVWVNAYRYGSSLLADYPSVNIISGERLYTEQKRDIIELISTEANILPGRNTYTGSGGFPQIRGRNGAVMLDGFSIDMPQLGGFDIGWIPQCGLGFVEVIKGPASVFFGSDALGGALNIIPFHTLKDTMESSIFFERGELNYKRTKGSITSKVSSWMKYRIDIVELGSDGARANENFYGNDFSGNFMFDILNNTERKLHLGFYGLRHKGTLLLPSTTPPSTDKTDITLALLSANYTHTSTKIFNLKLLLNNTKENFSSPFLASSHRNTIFSARSETFVDSTVVGKINLSFDCGYAEIKSSDVGMHRKWRYSAVFADKYQFTPKLSSLVAVRLDKPYTENLTVVPMGGVKVKIGNAFAFGNIRAGFRSPTLNDLYWQYQEFDYDGDGTPDYINEGNRNLISEVNWASEIGFGINDYGHITLFYSRANNLIEWRNVDPNLTFGHWKPINIKEWSNFKGLEIVSLHRFGGFGYSSKITVLDAKSSDKKRLPYRPIGLIDLGLNYNTNFLKGDGKIEVGLNGRYWYKLNDEFDQELESPLLLDGRIELSYLTASIFATVENILDKQYSLRRNYPQPGRVFRGGFSISFAY